MIGKGRIGRATLCLTQASLLIFGNASFALAAANEFSKADVTKMERLEKTLYGSTPHTSVTNESRLKSLETSMFGGSKAGSIQARLDAVDKALNVDRSQFLMPPQAGQLDHAPVKQAPAVVAEEHYQEEPKNPSQELLQEAMKQYSAGNTAAAEMTFKRVLTVDKNNADAYFNLGVLYEGKGDLQQALDNYVKAQTLNPKDAELKETVASLRNKLNQQRSNQIAEQQRAEQERATAQKHEELKQLVSSAASDYKRGSYAEAASKLERVSRDAPNDPDVQYALGQAYRAKGDSGRAKTAFNRALAIDPSSTLYKNALRDLNNSPQVANSPPPSASPYDAAQAYDNRTADNRPAGDITPFSDSGRSRTLGGYAEETGSGGYGRGGGLSASFGGLGMPGFSMSGGGGGRRLKRALVGGAAGAAAGAFLGGRVMGGGMKKNAMRGALLGGMLGYFSGP